MSLEAKHFYEFENFRLDTLERELRRDGMPVPLTPKAFQLLKILVENHGRIVDKEKLISEIWADSFVEDGNLAVSATILRKALDDSASHPTFIETVPRRGYRFIAEVRRRECDAAPALVEAPNDDDVPAPRSDSFHPTPGRSKLLVPLFVGAFSVIAAIAIGIYLLPLGKGDQADRRSIAVLPVKPIDATSRDEIFELGIADALILKLSSMKGLVVRPLSATRKYTDITQDPLAAGNEQKVDYVLDSNYQLADGKIRITAQLINIATGQIEDTYKNVKDTGNVFAMQDAIAGEVGSILLARFATTSNDSTAQRGTSDEEAYRLYLQGMYLSNNRTSVDARKAVAAFEEAVRLDPNYARAWAGKAYAHRAVGNFRRIADTHEEYLRSIEAINKALALDENLSEAYSALCENKMYYEYDFDGAERACKRAIELAPNSSLAHQVYSRYLPGRKRFDEAIAEIKTATDLEPASVFHQLMYGNILHYARRYPEAAAQYKRVLAMDENNLNAYLWLINTLAFQGKEMEAYDWFMRSLASQKADGETLRTFRTAYEIGGWQGVLLERAKRFEQTDEVYFRGAAYNAQIGNKDKAFEYLEKSYQRRELWMSYLQVDPLLDSLRDDPRFEDLVRRVERK